MTRTCWDRLLPRLTSLNEPKSATVQKLFSLCQMKQAHTHQAWVLELDTHSQKQQNTLQLLQCGGSSRGRLQHTTNGTTLKGAESYMSCSIGRAKLLSSWQHCHCQKLSFCSITANTANLLKHKWWFSKLWLLSHPRFETQQNSFIPIKLWKRLIILPESYIMCLNLSTFIILKVHRLLALQHIYL